MLIANAAGPPCLSRAASLDSDMRTRPEKPVRSRAVPVAILALIAVIGILLALWPTAAKVVQQLTPPDLPAPVTPNRTLTVDQGWTGDVRHKFHHISQGTSTFPVPLSWLLALEQPETSPAGLLWPSEENRFFDQTYLSRFGFIGSPKSPQNPHDLPVGFAVTPYQTPPHVSFSTETLGLTCAACHTGHFTYEGTEYVIEGGPSTVDLDALTNALDAALGQTMITAALPLPNRRFTRFARAVLGDKDNAASRDRLRSDLQTVLENAQTDRFRVLEGHGRLDALNRIGNQVFALNLDRPRNYAPISAPVNFPHIWTSMWFDWVQYDGSIMQPLVRNAGEALGVHAMVNTTAPVGDGRFASAVPVENLNWIEDTLAGPTDPRSAKAFGGLTSPKWPEALPPIDPALRKTGAALYDQHCAGCHLPPLTSEAFWSGGHFEPVTYKSGGIERQTQRPYLKLNIIPSAHVGTDPGQSRILMERTVDTAGHAGTEEPGLGLNALLCVRAAPGTAPDSGDLVEIRVTDNPMQNFGLALAALVQSVNDAWFEQARIPKGDRPDYQGNRPNCIQTPAGYKARPLNGVWATAPFLHNGSVPTLDDLLRPQDQRPRFVQLGSLDFDPVKVGVKQPRLSEESYPPYRNGYFILDTRLPGNRNTGHAFGPSADGTTEGMIGPALSDEDRAALIAFLKSL